MEFENHILPFWLFSFLINFVLGVVCCVLPVTSKSNAPKKRKTRKKAEEACHSQRSLSSAVNLVGVRVPSPGRFMLIGGRPTP